jgi:hypothetical protein
VTYTATDVAGNVTTCSFDVTVATIALPGSTGGEVPAGGGGETGGGQVPSLLSAPILLNPADAPLVGEYPLAAICGVGETLTGSFTLEDPTGLPMRGVYVILYLYSVELIDVNPGLIITLVDHWSVGYDTETQDWNFEIDTEILEPGYYYIYLSFPGGATLTLPVEVTAP